MFSWLEVVNYVHFLQRKLTCKIFVDEARFEAQVFDADVKVGVNFVHQHNLSPRNNQPYLESIQSERKPYASEEGSSCL